MKIKENIIFIFYRILSLVIFFLFLLSCFSFADKSDKKILGKVNSIKGNIYCQLRDSVDKKPLKVNDFLYGNMFVISDKESTATILLIDESLITIEPNSKIFINDYVLKDSQPGINVINGVLKNKVKKQIKKGTKFKVFSSMTVASVRGTEFEAGVAEDGSSKIVVTTGVVNVEADGSSNDVFSDEEVNSVLQREPLKLKSQKRSNEDWTGWQKDKKEILSKNPSENLAIMTEKMAKVKDDTEKLNEDIKIGNTDKDKNISLSENFELNKNASLGMYNRAETINSEFASDSLVNQYFAKIKTIQEAMDKLEEQINNKFKAIDEVYDKKAKELDKKFKDIEDKFKDIDKK